MAFTGTYSGNTLLYITQTGTDTNLSGLASFTYYDSPNISEALGFSIGWTGQAIYFINVPLLIQGTLTWDSSSETLVSSTSFPDSGSGFDYAIRITGSGASVSIGVQQGTNLDGSPRYSSGLGLVTGFDFTSPDPLNYIFNESVLIDTSAVLTVNGSEVQFASPLKITSNSGIVTFNGTIIVDLNNQTFSKQTIRNESPASNLRLNNVEFDSKYIAQRFINLSGLNTFSGIFKNSYIQPHRVESDPNIPTVGGKVTLSNVVFEKNFNSFDWQAVGNSTTATDNQAVELTNVDIGTKVRPNMAISGSDSLGHIAIFQNVKVIVEDTSFNPIENCNIRIPTTNSGNRNNTLIGGQFIGNLDFTSTTYSEYTDQTISTGESQQFKVLTGRIWNDDLSNTTFTYDLYGKSQVVGEDKFDIQFRSYLHNYATQESVFNGDFDLVFKRVLTTDTNITETNNTNVDAYTDLGTAQKIYDAFKSEWLDLTLDKLILDRVGNKIDLDKSATSLIIDATAVNVRNFTGTVATVKALSYNGGAFTNSSGTVTTRNGALLNGGTFDCDVNYESGANTTLTNVTVNQTIDFNTSGTYTIDGGLLNEVTNSSGGNITLALLNGATVTTNTGPNITLTQNVNATAPNILDGTRVQFFNVTQNYEISITVVSGGSGYSATVDLLSSIIDDGDDIALRCSFYDATNGDVYDDLEILGSISIFGFNSSLSQSLNTVISSIHSKGTDYHGSNVSGFSLDVATLQIDSNIVVINGQKLATWFAHEIATTDDGIRNYFNSIQSIDDRNFRFSKAIQVQNVGYSAVWIGASWVRLDGNPIVAPNSATIQFNNALTFVPSVGSKDDEIDAIKAKTDLFTFNGNDVKATLDGEQVVASNITTPPTVTEIRAGFDENDFKADVTNLDTTISSRSTFDPASDTVARVTLVDTTTSNTDMRGTNNANTTAPDNSSITQIKNGLDNLNDITAADVYAEFTSGNNEDAFKAVVSNLATQASVDDLNDLSTSDIWSHSTRTLTSSSLTEADIANAVWDESYSNHTTAGTFGKLMDLLRKANRAIDGEVTGTPTVSSFETNLTGYLTGAFNSEVMVFVSGAINGEARPILSYNSTNGRFNFEEQWTQAPNANDEFVILPYHVHAISEIQNGLASQTDVTTAKNEIIADNRLFQEADEEITPTAYKKMEKGTSNIIVQKNYANNGAGAESLTEPT